MSNLSIFLSFLPFIAFLYFLLWRKYSLLKTSLLSLLLITALAWFYWRMTPDYLFGSYIKGFLVALDIFFVVCGAIFFLEILRDLKIIDNISSYLEHFSKDYRVQVILLAWFLENFLEGTAGFGAPSTVVGPLLVGLGLPPIQAVVIGLLGNSSSVIFGAAGTPIRIGYAGLDIAQVPLYTAAINCIGLIVPVFMLWFLTLTRQNGRRDFWEALPFAIWAGVAFVVPSLLTVGLGQEFPSILGAIIGFIIIFGSAKIGLFMPRTIRTMRDEKIPPRTIPLLHALFPYFLLITLLIVGKFAIGNLGIQIPSLIKHTISYYNPGFAFIIAGFVTALLWRKRNSATFRYLRLAAGKSVEPFLVIVIMSAIVQIMIYSHQNTSGLPSFIVLMAQTFQNSWLPFWAPLLGAFGSFITGSATVSNIMFGALLSDAAQALGMSIGLILSLGLVGGAAGNMIALADVLTAETVVGIKHQERILIKLLIFPCLLYVLLAGLIGMIII